MLDFVKMHGLGNDFVVLDGRDTPIPVTPDLARAIADRRYGVGCDQLIVLEPSRRADVFMRIYNPDGSQSGACGNATRCVAQVLMREGERDAATIETLAGVLRASGSPERITVDMGAPRLGWREIPLAHPVADTARVPHDATALKAGLPAWFGAVNMGNPHAVFFVDDVEAHDLARTGPRLEADPVFPERANISLVAVAAPGHLIQKVWERGAGLTLACGSG
ncbi:MAG TPA: diaminopimelate epimerase, partial [Beijerinckiaceae bacterium]|nr:diaminopimelate epimerase [Beijerinckiaceae bacterium]